MNVKKLLWYLGGDRLFSTFSELLSLAPPVKDAGNPIITHDATYTNYAPASNVFTDPTDQTKLLFYVGEFPGNSRTNARLSLYTAPKDDPFTKTRYGVVIDKGIDNTYKDQNGASGIVGGVDVSGTIWLFYTGIQGTGAGSESICAASSTDGRTFTKHGQVFAPDGVNEFNITDADVRIFNGVAYMYYTAKTATVPTLGIRTATASPSNLLSWTRSGVNIISLGSATEFDGKYIEGAQIIQIPDGNYVCLYTTSSPSNIWSVGIAHSSSPNIPFTQESLPFFQHGPSGWDINSAAVPLLYNIGSRWFFEYQGTTQIQPASIWDIGGAELTVGDDFPIGFLTGRSLWTGSTYFDTQSEVTVGSLGRSVRGLNNVGAAGVNAIYPIDVTPGAGSLVGSVIRCSSGTGNFRGGFYIREGTNLITGIYFDDTGIKHLRSSGWTTIQIYAANTNYTVEVLLTSNSTYNVKLNGVQVVTAAACFTNITTKANSVMLEKDNASTALVYYGDLKYNNLGGGDVYLDIGQ